MRRLAVVINMNAGGIQDKGRQLRDILNQADIEDSQVYLAEASHVDSRIVQLRDAGSPVIAVGGGDGTLNTAANLLAGTEIALGILPLGTFNHFAKDLGVPLNIEDAVQTLLHSKLQAIDLGAMNERRFINNASIGMYPHAVSQREAYQEELGLSKMTAMGYALLRIFHRPPLVHIELSGQENQQSLNVPFIFIGNNQYEKTPFSLIRRQSLDQGHLSVFYTHRMTRWALFKLALQILFGRLQKSPELIALRPEKLIITSRKSVLKVALDGEVVHATTPLEFRICAASLQVIAPASTQ